MLRGTKQKKPLRGVTRLDRTHPRDVLTAKRIPGHGPAQPSATPLAAARPGGVQRPEQLHEADRRLRAHRGLRVQHPQQSLQLRADEPHRVVEVAGQRGQRGPVGIRLAQDGCRPAWPLGGGGVA